MGVYWDSKGVTLTQYGQKEFILGITGDTKGFAKAHLGFTGTQSTHNKAQFFYFFFWYEVEHNYCQLNHLILKYLKT